MSDKSARDTVQDAYNEESGIKREGKHVTPANPKQWIGANRRSDDKSLHSGQKPLREAAAKLEIQTEVIDDEPWFRTKEVCESLGLSDVYHARKEIFDYNQQQLPVQVNTGVAGQVERDVWFVNEPGLYHLIAKSQKAEAAEVAEVFGLPTNLVHIIRAEAEIVSQLQTVFRSHKIVTQYAVAGNGKAYYVDLVFPSANLVVEIDEHGHESYNAEEEQARDYAVQKEGFTLLRHNPHEAPVIELIADIHEHLHPDL